MTGMHISWPQFHESQPGSSFGTPCRPFSHSPAAWQPLIHNALHMIRHRRRINAHAFAAIHHAERAPLAAGGGVGKVRLGSVDGLAVVDDSIAWLQTIEHLAAACRKTCMSVMRLCALAKSLRSPRRDLLRQTRLPSG